MDDELIQQATRMANRAGMPLSVPPPSTTGTPQSRLSQAEERKEWEKERLASTHLYENDEKENKIKRGVTIQTGRSALSKRTANNSKPDVFMPEVGKGLDPKTFADGKKELQDELQKEIKNSDKGVSSTPSPPILNKASLDAIEEAAAKTSEIVAKAGAGNAFEGESLGIGGLDEVLSQVKRRIWVPLAGEQ